MHSKLPVLQKWILCLKANNPFLFLFLLVSITHLGLIQAALLLRETPMASPPVRPIATKIYVEKKHIPPEPKLGKKHIPPVPDPFKKEKSLSPSKKVYTKNFKDQQKILSDIASIRKKQNHHAHTELIDVAPFEFKAQTSSTDENISSFILGLQSAIELPKKGNIQLSFQVSSSGSIDHVVILDSDDPDNAAYLIALLTGRKIPFYAGKKDQILLTINGVPH